MLGRTLARYLKCKARTASRQGNGSPSLPPASLARRSRSRSSTRRILPLIVFGSSVTNSISRGYLYGYGAVPALAYPKFTLTLRLLMPVSCAPVREELIEV
jgi:hypothetical protein